MGLTRKFNAHVAGADLIEAFRDRPLRQFRTIAIAAEMAQIDMAKIRCHHFLKRIGSGGIG